MFLNSGFTWAKFALEITGSKKGIANSQGCQTPYLGVSMWFDSDSAPAPGCCSLSSWKESLNVEAEMMGRVLDKLAGLEAVSCSPGTAGRRKSYVLII